MPEKKFVLSTNDVNFSVKSREKMSKWQVGKLGTKWKISLLAEQLKLAKHTDLIFLAQRLMETEITLAIMIFLFDILFRLLCVFLCLFTENYQ
jgi:hypothetical protein